MQIQCTNGKVVLNRKLFVWNANEFCMRFKEKKIATEFVEEWEAWVGECNATVTPTLESQCSEMPPAKRIRIDEKKEPDEKWMDDIDYEIEQHKVGMSVALPDVRSVY